MILKYFQKFFAIIYITLIISAPFLSQALNGPGANEAESGVNSGDATTIINPLGDKNDIVALVDSLINVAIQIGIPVATLALVYAGFKYVTAAGNQSDITKAHQIIQDILWGIAIILGAKAILASIDATITNLK